MTTQEAIKNALYVLKENHDCIPEGQLGDDYVETIEALEREIKEIS